MPDDINIRDNSENATWNATHDGNRVPWNDTDAGGAPSAVVSNIPEWEEGSWNRAFKAYMDLNGWTVLPEDEADFQAGIMSMHQINKYGVVYSAQWGYKGDARYKKPGDQMSSRALPTANINYTINVTPTFEQAGYSQVYHIGSGIPWSGPTIFTFVVQEGGGAGAVMQVLHNGDETPIPMPQSSEVGEFIQTFNVNIENPVPYPLIVAVRPNTTDSINHLELFTLAPGATGFQFQYLVTSKTEDWYTAGDKCMGDIDFFFYADGADGSSATFPYFGNLLLINGLNQLIVDGGCVLDHVPPVLYPRYFEEARGLYIANQTAQITDYAPYTDDVSGCINWRILWKKETADSVFEWVETTMNEGHPLHGTERPAAIGSYIRAAGVTGGQYVVNPVGDLEIMHPTESGTTVGWDDYVLAHNMAGCTCPNCPPPRIEN